MYVTDVDQIDNGDRLLLQSDASHGTQQHNNEMTTFDDSCRQVCVVLVFNLLVALSILFQIFLAPCWKTSTQKASSQETKKFNL